MGRSGHKSISKEPTQRMLRVGEVIRRAVDECLRRGEVRDPELERIMITVPEARMSSDLKLASVYVAPLGGGDGEELARLLNDHSKFIRRRVARDMTLKYMPDISQKFWLIWPLLMILWQMTIRLKAEYCGAP